VEKKKDRFVPVLILCALVFMGLCVYGIYIAMSIVRK
jgi:hypothetical protein